MNLKPLTVNAGYPEIRFSMYIVYWACITAWIPKVDSTGLIKASIEDSKPCIAINYRLHSRSNSLKFQHKDWTRH